MEVNKWMWFLCSFLQFELCGTFPLLLISLPYLENVWHGHYEKSFVFEFLVSRRVRAYELSACQQDSLPCPFIFQAEIEKTCVLIPFFINAFWIQVLHAVCVCFVLLTNSGFGRRPVLFYPYLFYFFKLSCSFSEFLCCDAHNFFLKQYPEILIFAERKRIYTVIRISKITRNLSKFYVSCTIIQKIKFL